MPSPDPAPDRRAAKGAALGAVFLMATSAIGPGFLTQTTVFTERLRADFAFAILASVLIDVAAQANVWRVLGVARLRGQELASALVPGLGVVVAALVAAGGLVFNVGNVAGCALGLQVFGVPPVLGATLSAVLGLVVVARPTAGRPLDLFSKGLGALMLVLTAVIVVVSRPDYAAAVRGAVWPSRVELLPVVTLVGGTVGGYITFSGVHRLLDAGMGGVRDLPRLTGSAVSGILVTAVMRVLLFLAVLGVVSHAGALDPANPAASAFRHGAGEWGYRFFGVVLWAAAITSVVGCTYTSLSFLRGLWAPLDRHLQAALVAFVGVSLLFYLMLGRPVRLLIAAGALNALILPVTLGVVLLAARRKDLMGDYRHPVWLGTAGALAWLISVAAGILSLKGLAKL